MRYINRLCARAHIIFCALLTSINVFGVEWVPTDPGLIVDLKPGDRIMLSVVVNGQELFVCHYHDFTNNSALSPYTYTKGHTLKLIAQEKSEPSAASIWTVDTALTRIFREDNKDNNYALGGIAYTIHSSSGYTLLADDGEGWKIQGNLSNSESNSKLCDVAFAVPTVRANEKVFPNGTFDIGDRNRGNGLNGTKTWAFDGKTGTGYAGKIYREVFMFAIPRSNKPRTYTNSTLVGFNTTNGNVNVRGTNYGPGKTIWAYGDSLKYGSVPRTLFRLYILEKEPFNTCPDSYFFAYNEQNYLKYRRGDPKASSGYKKMTDSTTVRKIYTTDHLYCMEHIGNTESSIWKTDLLYVPVPDSTYYYVGDRDKFRNTGLGSGGAVSGFTKIRQLPVLNLAGKYAPAGACGRMVVDTTSGAKNLGVAFEPVGYFLRTSRGKNIQLTPNEDGTAWTSEEAWTITADSVGLNFKTKLYTGAAFSTTDTGADIAGWSAEVAATSLQTLGGESVIGKSGWLRIFPGDATTNGGLVMVVVDANRYIRYHNNGHFGMDIPDQHPLEGSTLTVQNARLLEGYTFTGWNTQADGNGTTYAAGATVNPNDFPDVGGGKYVLDLYAQATYTGDINVAISFLKGDGKRYFLTLSGEAPRYARARAIADWTNAWQGMGDYTNTNPNYLNTFRLIGNSTAPLPCAECQTNEYVLDPHRSTMHGSVDSLVFWAGNQPDPMEYVGLYYSTVPTTINTLLANNTWAGLFTSSEGWPTPAHPCIDSTRIRSDWYLTGWPDNVKNQRDGLPNEVKYIASDNQFDGAATGAGTDFMISGVGVVDEHYVILPDTTDEETPWKDAITFDFHENEQTTEEVWSKLIGKQLLAQMKVGNEIIYFHPNNAKTMTSASALRLSPDYRLTHSFNYIRDARVEAQHEVSNGDKPTMEETEDAFHCTITSGENSPLDVKSGGQFIDIVDTLRVMLRPANSSKIKDYYGRWKTGAEGVHVRPDGARYRDILVTTKTYHYADTTTSLRLVPAKDPYTFGSVNGLYEDLSFTLQWTTTHLLKDVEGNIIREEIISAVDTTSLLDLTSAGTIFTLKKGDLYFIKGEPTTTGIRLTTKTENTSEYQNWDTLTVNTTVTIGGTPTAVTAQVPLLQVSTIGTELVWSVEYSGQRYFIFATSTGLRYKTFSVTNNRLVNAQQELIIGAGNADNSDEQYITPWSWTDQGDPALHQLTLETKYGVNRNFYVNGAPGTHASNKTTLTYEFVDTYTNENGNYEELVYLQCDYSKWLKFDGSKLVVVENKDEASVFSWAYMLPEYYLLNNGVYPSKEKEEFTYNSTRTGSVQTRYQAYLDHSMLLNNQFIRVAKVNETRIDSLIAANRQWKTNYTVTLIRDNRDFDGGSVSSGLNISTNAETLTTSITQSGNSPQNVKYNGQYVNIVDTLDFRISLQDKAPTYRFDAWDGVSSLEEAHLKIPLIRRTYHPVPYDSVLCDVEDDDYNYAFPSRLREGVRADSLHTFTLNTLRHIGNNMYNVYNEIATAIQTSTADLTSSMDLTNSAMSEIRLVDEFGNKPSWCEIHSTTTNTVTVKCLSNGVRSPRVAYLYFAYVVMVEGKMRFVNYHLTVSQASLFYYANNQQLIHSAGASGDSMMADGRQFAHENKRILYYYNPKPYNEPDQFCELPVRERGFYGWWRWYREGKDQNGVDVGDTDIPDSVWSLPPQNYGKKGKDYNYDFRIIGDSVWEYTNNEKTDSVRKLVTMGRYTVFHYPAIEYDDKGNPPAKSPKVKPPFNKDTVTYVVDISNYYDNLPLSMSNINQVDTGLLERMNNIVEPTLSLREIFELHPWTEMAERLDTFKTHINNEGVYTNDKFMEDHVVMAPVGNRLLLQTEQRYNYHNLSKQGHSESLLGYYMRDDNWSSWGADPLRQDTMIWCGGWTGEPQCLWFTYDTTTHQYTGCDYKINEAEDFLEVPAKGGITEGQEFDTVYYCLRARSKKSTFAGNVATSVDGDYWFNICRYKIIYHNTDKYGPKLESLKNGVVKSLITNDEIENNYEVLERLDFDYNKPGDTYTIYPHPLPWADGSYGYTYPLESSALPNRFHAQTDFPGPGEYALINYVKYNNNWWRGIQQHGGKANGYMLYCDGMSAAGQVAALSLSTNLCEGQKLYFSGYIANVSKQKNEKVSDPNFTFTVQGSVYGTDWEDITTYMTGEMAQSETAYDWYQIFFPIEQKHEYNHFRVRIYNNASNFDGNDFAIDDMCIFATKPPLIAYQAQTKCVENASENDSLIHVVLRVDYQGFIDESYNNAPVYYTVEQKKNNNITFVPMVDGYLHEDTIKGVVDTLYGRIQMPAHNYEPSSGSDSIFINLNKFAERFEQSLDSQKVHPERPLFRQGYIYETLDGQTRPVLYVVHNAKMTSDNQYKVRMSLTPSSLMSSKCAMTSELNVTNQMMLMLDGEEQEVNSVDSICGNVTYDLSMRVKGVLIQDGVPPIDLKGSCVNDWLLYGDTARESSKKRYGYYYSDIVKVVKDILRYEPAAGESNANQFARSLGAVSKTVMNNILNKYTAPYLETTDHPYVVLTNLVNNGFLQLYKSDLTAALAPGDSVQYVVFPILGTGTADLQGRDMEVCPTPLVIKLKSKPNLEGAPMILGGLHRDSTQNSKPIIVLADALQTSSGVLIPVDSIRTNIGVHSVELTSTNDPNFREGVHRLEMTPDRSWPGENYYRKGDTILLTPASTNNYTMRQGYSYTYSMTMVTGTENPLGTDGCPIGKVVFTLSYVPDYIRWNPQSPENNQWNNPDNWIGVNAANKSIIHNEARFVPLPSTKVIIPALPDSMSYPDIPSTISAKDSVQEVGFAYNACEVIRILPGAAIGNQQNLIYDNAIVDMRMKQKTWALRAAPVTGMLSGDLFLSNADLLSNSNSWEVGEFDAAGRNYTTGNASFWLSLFSQETIRKGNNDQVADSTMSAAADWSKVTNGLTLPLPTTQGFAVYAYPKKSSSNVDIRLPKDDDRYYYYTKSGNKLEDLYEDNLRHKRDSIAVASGAEKAGRLAYKPVGEGQSLTITNGKNTAGNVVKTKSIVFGNPTVGYIDIWGFIADNSSILAEKIIYLNSDGLMRPRTKAEATKSSVPNQLNRQERYLPPTQAIMIELKDSATSVTLTLNKNRIVTKPVTPPASPAPKRMASAREKGIMTIIAVNPVSSRCVSYLLLGQGYDNAIQDGEDAVLTTFNIDNFTMFDNPTTPFNIYAVNDGYGMSIDLRESIETVPLSFYMSDLPYDSKTQLWFSGVNEIDGQLFLYDALTDTERPILDGICWEIETPERNHERRYYIRRIPTPEEDPEEPITTSVGPQETTPQLTEQAVKIMYNGHVLILRNGHVYTMYGQKLR